MTDDTESGSIPLPNGCTLCWKTNEVGGRTYVSDEIPGGIEVWNTALMSESTLLAAIVNEARLVTIEYHRMKQNHPGMAEPIDD